MREKSSVGVGHGMPPKASQFQKGRSGNPRGRPKGSKNLATLIAQSAYDKIMVVTKNGVKRKLSRIEATLLQLATKAARGEDRAMAEFIELVAGEERRALAARPPELPIGEKDFIVLHEVYKRMQDCAPADPPPFHTGQ